MITRRGFLTLAAGAALATGAGASFGRQAPSARAALTTVVASPVPSPESALVLRVEFTGGFVPAEFLLTQLPAFSLYADGTVITTGPMIEIFPQPALPNLRAMQLTQEGIDLVLVRAREAGLLQGDRNYENRMIADAPSTVFTTIVDGKSERVSAYALGYGEEMLPDSTEAEARAKLIEFEGFLFDLAANLPAEVVAQGDEAYEIERLRIYARPIDAANPPWADSGLEQSPMTWPLPEPLPAFGAPYDRPDLYGGAMRCGVAREAEAQDLLTELASANVLTPWESEGTLYQVWVRPLLPDEDGC
jgi:hypothetical protein